MNRPHLCVAVSYVVSEDKETEPPLPPLSTCLLSPRVEKPLNRPPCLSEGTRAWEASTGFPSQLPSRLQTLGGLLMAVPGSSGINLGKRQTSKCLIKCQTTKASEYPGHFKASELTVRQQACVCWPGLDFSGTASFMKPQFIL